MENLLKSRLAIYTAGYPRSGNTWLGRLLSDVLSAPYGGILATDCVCYGPDNCDSGKHVIIKTHATQKYGTTVFIHRDPRDVVVSAHHYRVCDLERAINSMLKCSMENVTVPYLTYVNNWLRHGLADVIVRYEDLLSNGFETVCRILDAIGITIPEERILAAIRRQEFAETKKRLSDESNNHAMWRGKSGTWREYMTREQGKRFADVFQTHLLEYEFIAPGEQWWEQLN